LLSNKTREYIQTAARLKKKLLNYYKNKEQRYKPIILEQVKYPRPSQDLLANGIEWFIYCYRFKNGDTFIDRFIKGRRDLSELEKSILEGWKESFEGIFMIKSVGTDAVVLLNLLDNTDYVAASDLGENTLKDLRPDHYIATRLIPLDDIYLFSGVQYFFPPEAKDTVEEMVMQVLETNPLLASGGKKKIWRKLRNKFISHFGSDVIVIPGRELAATINRFVDLCYMNKETGPMIDFPEDLTGRDTAGVIMDETEGLNFYPDFQLFMAPFNDPQLLADHRHRNTIMGYLESNTISTLPFRQMIEKYPENSRQVFAELFNKETWDNDKDFDLLMKKYKGRPAGANGSS